MKGQIHAVYHENVLTPSEYTIIAPPTPPPLTTYCNYNDGSHYKIM